MNEPDRNRVTWFPALPSEGWTSMDRYWRELYLIGNSAPPPDLILSSALPTPPPASSVKGGRWRRVLDKYYLYPMRAKRHEADLCHILDQSYAHLLPHLPASAIKVATVFDLVPLEDKGSLTEHQVARFRRTVENLKHADHLVSISEETKRKVTFFLGIPPEKISVAVPGTDFASFRKPVAGSNPVRTRLAALPPAILSVGAFINRKNLQSLPAIFREMEPFFREKRCCFVRAGDPVSDALRKEITAITGEEGFIELGLLFGDDLIAAYQSARALIFPSTLEGLTFVIPEAMAAGCAVVTNRMTANPEAGGDAALYYSEGNPAEAAEKLAALLTDDELHSGFRRRGELRAKEWTWERHFNHLIEIYRSLLGRDAH